MQPSLGRGYLVPIADYPDHLKGGADVELFGPPFTAGATPLGLGRLGASGLWENDSGLIEDATHFLVEDHAWLLYIYDIERELRSTRRFSRQAPQGGLP